VRTEALFLSLLFSGIAALIGGLLVTRVHWRPDIPPYGRRTRSLQVIVHPERYVRDAPLTAIRILNAAGFLLLTGAAAVVGYDLVRTVVRQ
jgi:hypothetical protein